VALRGSSGAAKKCNKEGIVSIERAREYLQTWSRGDQILEFTASSATVELAARALNVEEARIAKTLSLKKGEQAVLIVTAGDVRIDNRKYKDLFGCKARMLSPDEVRRLIGHEVGGVCPFGIEEDVEVYLDISLKRFSTVFPACGSSSSAIELTCGELAEISRSRGWIDVCK